MEKRQKSEFLRNRKEFQSSQTLKKRKKAGDVERCGETSFLDNSHYKQPPGFSPFSPLALSLQTPHTTFQTQELPRHMTSGSERDGSFKNVFEELHKRPLYQLVFLCDDEDQSVEVKEVEEIDFEELRTRLQEGESVFITKRENEKIELIDLDEDYEKKDARKPWFVAHI